MIILKIKSLLNPCPPEIFSVTHPTKGGCCNPFLYSLYQMPLCLLPMYSYGSLLSIDTKKSTIFSSYDVSVSYNVSAPLKFWE